MKAYNLNFLFLLIAFITSSCFSINQGNISSNVVESNLTYKETAMGQASSIIILGFGASKRNDLVNKAKRDLEAKRFLAPNERYINYVIDKKTTYYFGIVIKQIFTVHADIIALNQEEDNPMSREFKENYLVQSPKDIKILGPIAIGKYWHFVKQNDPIYLADGTKALINDLTKRKATIFYISENAYKKKTVNISEIFFEVNSNNLAALKEDLVDVNEKGEVIAFSKNKILVKSEDQKFKVIDQPSSK
ncbi:DUF6567 family protein [Marivirga sp.]|uniref:DUF6567 family protein n=1 Tax=Marivirga sp. TaxID=2018662 RepID=UPI002D7E74E8|nr:DUF6567 family protein [Marivirga sp.]HET8861358.1 DUF6567 family protein [Marivirga sp.]